MEKNIFKLLLDRRNRKALVGIILIAVITIVSIITYKYQSEKNSSAWNGVTITTKTHESGSSAAATGNESAAYIDQVDIYNTQTLQERKKINPSAHPIPTLDDELNPKACDANHDAWVNCLRASGILGANECSPTDTQCMILQGHIGSNDCAPADIVCQKQKGIWNPQNSKKCSPTDKACIARRAAETGCGVKDSACLRKAGVINSDECVPGDSTCNNTPTFCSEHDSDCITARAAEAGCEISDTQCLRRNGIIASTACAPDDRECKSKRTQCSPDDIACLLEKAREAGCEIDDSRCLVAAGIIPKDSCSPLDENCIDTSQKYKCEGSDYECIKNEAAKSGCALNDTSCLRKAGIISEHDCAPGDKACKDRKDSYCSELDVSCIKERAKKAGCSLDDTKCLRERGVIATTACAPEDFKCQNNRKYCSPDDVKCIEDKAQNAGCMPDDSNCLVAAGILKPGECAVNDRNCKANDKRNNSSSTEDKKGKCSVSDYACIAKEAKKHGCSPSDSDCLREKGIIGQDECSPSDAACNANKIIKCAPDDLACISREAKKAGCKTSDLSCLRKKGIIGDNETPGGAIKGAGQRGSSYMDEAKKGNQNTLSEKELSNLRSEWISVAKKAKSRTPKRIAVDFSVENDDQKAGERNSSNDEFSNAALMQELAAMNDGESTEPSGVNNVEESRGEPFIRTGTVKLGITDLAYSSDYEGPVSITMPDKVGSPVRNSTLTGKMVHLEDKLRLELDLLTLTNGKQIPINAIALDLETTYAAVASEVDHHYLYRYGWWGVGTALSAFGQAAVLASKTTAVTEGGTIVEGTEMDADAELRAALGFIGEEVGSTMKDRINRKKTIRINLHEEVGLFFKENVYLKDAK